MHPITRRRGRWETRAGAAALTAGLALSAVVAGGAPVVAAEGDFALPPLDAQDWQNQYDMTWDDYTPIPGTQWNDPALEPTREGLSIALVPVDFPDQEFVITQPEGSDLFGNPQIAPVTREEVPQFYRDFYMEPNDLNHGRTIQEYWFEMSNGEYGVDSMDVYGPYELPRRLFEYGLGEFEQEPACPDGFTCDGNMNQDAVAVWTAGMAAQEGVTPEEWCAAKTAELGGSARNCGYDVILRVYAGYDETSIWQEFGPMLFPTKEQIPDEWGPPADVKGDLENWAPTRYVEWTSWQAAAQQWGQSSIRQGESSGTITHEMGHFFFSIGDNNNNPFSDRANPPTPFHRVGAAPWDMFDRGSFNGPGGHHMRWVVPANMGGWSPAGLLLRNKVQMQIVEDENVLTVDSADLAGTGVLVDDVVARAVYPGEDGTSGIRVLLDGGDRSPACDIDTDPLCDGNDWDDYTLEVVDRMGFDSFTPDSGVIIAKNKAVGELDENGERGRGKEGDSCGYNCFNWVIDANPEDIGLVDYYAPTVPGEWAEGGTPVVASIADHRQLNDAAFKAGLGSGSEYEWVDEANRLHFYVVDTARDEQGVLSYRLAVRSLDGSGPQARGVEVGDAEPEVVAPGQAATCTFPVANTGAAGTDPAAASDVYRITAETDAEGWTAQLQNALAAAPAGGSADVPVWAVRGADAADEATVTIRATSESDPTKTATSECAVTAALLDGVEPTAPPTEQPDAPTVAVDPQRVAAGDEVRVTGAGLEPGAAYAIELRSTPVTLGTVEADTDGGLAATVEVPASTPPGAHTIALVQDGETVAAAALEVTASGTAGGSGSGGLAYTGAESGPWWAVAAALVLAGIATLTVGVVRRRRRA